MTYRVVIPSGSASNLAGTVRALREKQPDIDRERLVVVADRLPRELATELDVTWIEGEQPFIFSRNVNAGVQACADADVIMMADDVELVTEGGFDLLIQRMHEHPEAGLIAPGVSGAMCREAQIHKPGHSIEIEEDWLSFVCLLLPRAVWDAIGPMDEQFDGYGFDDVDYSWRVRGAGKTLVVDHRCQVSHCENLLSVYRNVTPEDHLAASNHNERILRAKWNLPPMPVSDAPDDLIASVRKAVSGPGQNDSDSTG